MKILTIGVYGFDETTFFQTLQTAGVDGFCDIRWRRGVRGAAYAFVNAGRLQKRLETLGIRYLPRRDLAPPPDIRQHQLDVDKQEKIAKRQRSTLSVPFITAYQESILSSFDPNLFLEELPPGLQTLAFFCVEREPAACHRSLVAEKIGSVLGVPVEHLLPPP